MAAADVFTLADGVLLHVDDAGQGGLPVVFQHGLCGDAGQTREAFPADPRFRRITVEMRGHGGSQAGDPGRFAIATFAEDLAACIADRLSGPVVLGGISMGAAIALRLAVTRPELVRGLVIARPAWIAKAAPANMAPNAEVGHRLADMPPEAAREAFLRGDTARRLAETAPDNLASLLGFFSRAPAAVTSALLTTISGDGPGVTEDEIRAIKVPTLVIGQAHDSVHPLAHAHAIADLITAARCVRITPKAVDRTVYVAEFRAAMAAFLEDFL